MFNRPLGIKRNAVVLPNGYELVACNYPSQVLQEADGRIKITFWNATPAEAPLILRARRAAALGAKPSSVAGEPRSTSARYQNREIVYFLQQPETHAFDLYHDYTESRPGTSTYLNVVRAGSTVSKPSARNLDTGEMLTHEVLVGDAITKAKLEVPDVTPTTEVVVFRFPAVKQGQSIRLRMFETYTDTARYKLAGDELVWDRGFGRPMNAVVLPSGWVLTNSSIPATVSTLRRRPHSARLHQPPPRRNPGADHRPPTLIDAASAGLVSTTATRQIQEVGRNGTYRLGRCHCVEEDTR